MIICIYFFMFSEFILSNIDSETAEIFKKGDFEFWAWAPLFYYDLKYNR